jgi:hypothetical protein
MNIIDRQKLCNVKFVSDGWQAQCPACFHLEGRDKAGNHLKVWKNNAFNCVVYPGDKEHNNAILQLAGTEGDGNVTWYSEPQTPNEPQYYKDEVLTELIRDFSYWEKRGINKETMQELEGGVASKNKMDKRYVLPLRDINNRIIAFTGRYLLPLEKNSKVARWKIIGKKSLAVYPHYNKEVIQEKKEVILVEGAGCAIALRNAGIFTALSMFGTKVSSSLLSYIISVNPNRIIIATNNEASAIGNEAAQEIRGILSYYFDEGKIFERLPPKKDFMEMNISGIMEWYSKI